MQLISVRKNGHNLTQHILDKKSAYSEKIEILKLIENLAIPVATFVRNPVFLLKTVK